MEENARKFDEMKEQLIKVDTMKRKLDEYCRKIC